MPGIDEFTLAAYVGGTLPEERRAEVAAYLADHADARELLQMAHESLKAGQRGTYTWDAPPTSIASQRGSAVGHRMVRPYPGTPGFVGWS